MKNTTHCLIIFTKAFVFVYFVISMGGGLYVNASSKPNNIEIMENHITYKITTSCNNNKGGICIGGGMFNQNEFCYIYAILNPGYEFVYWTENGKVISTNPNLIFIATKDRAINANFVMKTYRINVSVDPMVADFFINKKEFFYNEKCTLIVKPHHGNKLISLSINERIVSSELYYTFKVQGDITITAKFKKMTYYVKTTVSNLEGCICIGKGNYEHGDFCHIYAIPDPDSIFVNFEENGVVISTDPNMIIIVESNRNIIANFHKI